MKSYKLDFSALAKEKVSANPAIHIVGAHCINGGFAFLTKGTNGKYFWSDITASYSIAQFNDKEEFNSEWEAISNVLQDDYYNELYEFDNIEDFCAWYLNRNKK